VVHGLLRNIGLRLIEFLRFLLGIRSSPTLHLIVNLALVIHQGVRGALPWHLLGVLQGQLLALRIKALIILVCLVGVSVHLVTYFSMQLVYFGTLRLTN